MSIIYPFIDHHQHTYTHLVLYKILITISFSIMQESHVMSAIIIIHNLKWRLNLFFFAPTKRSNEQTRTNTYSIRYGAVDCSEQRI